VWIATIGPAEAERRGLAGCAKNARDRAVTVWFNDNCGGHGERRRQHLAGRRRPH
jgi:hypothetical protein